ncbi:LOW QUALITY PROTEIN: transmembrane protein 235 [Aulostomus maculatus]
MIAAGISGSLSFSCLATSLGTEYRYIIIMNTGDLANVSSQSGQWSIDEVCGVLPLSQVLLLFGGICGLGSSQARSLVLHGTVCYFFTCKPDKKMKTQLRTPDPQRLPDCCMKETTNSEIPAGKEAPSWLNVTCTSNHPKIWMYQGVLLVPVNSETSRPDMSLFTLCGVSLYIIYSYQALAEDQSLVGLEGLAHVRTSFGWSLGLASALLLIAVQMAKLQHCSPSWPDRGLSRGPLTCRMKAEFRDAAAVTVK